VATINTDAQVIKDSLADHEKQTLKFQFRDFIKFFGDGSAGQKETPERILKMYEELLTAKEPAITLFDAENYDQMIVDKGIKFYTFCEHHILPFFGEVTIGYIPDKKIIGLSKLARIVDYFSKRLNTQEYFTQNIADYLTEKLNPLGVGVKVDGLHLCKVMRGAKANGTMITSSLKGVFRDKGVREEFFTI